MTADIDNESRYVPFVETEEVEEITGELIAWNILPGELSVRGFRHAGRQQ